MENSNNQRLFGMLGFAMRAGKLVIGTDNIIHSLKKGQARLVVVSKTASEGTKSRLSTKSEFYKTVLIEVDIDAERLGKMLGKTYAPVAVAVTDERFAEEIKKASV